MSANQISQNFLSAENFPEWKWAFKLVKVRLPVCTGLQNLKYSIDYLGWAFANTPQVVEDDRHWNVEMIWTLGRCNT